MVEMFTPARLDSEEVDDCEPDTEAEDDVLPLMLVLPLVDCEEETRAEFEVEVPLPRASLLDVPAGGVIYAGAEEVDVVGAGAEGSKQTLRVYSE